MMNLLDKGSSNMIIYQITIPKKQNTEAFVKFMREKYFPAVRKGQTRVGQVISLKLLEQENAFVGDDLRREFLLHIGWSGLPFGEIHLENQEVLRKFEAFKAEVKRLGSYGEVAVWDDQIAA